MRFGTSAKVLVERKLKYHNISECLAIGSHLGVAQLCSPLEPLQGCMQDFKLPSRSFSIYQCRAWETKSMLHHPSGEDVFMAQMGLIVPEVFYSESAMMLQWANQ